MKLKKIFFIGCGAVGFALLEIMKRERLYYNCQFTLIEPRDIADISAVMTGRKYTHVKERMTRENYSSLLKDVDPSSLIVNVSVNVDSIMLLQFCKEKKALYVDTSLEQYQDYSHTNPTEVERYSEFKKNNLYHQQLEAEKVTQHAKRSMAVSSGFNPGYISEFAKKALVEYAKTKGKRLVKNNYAKLAHSLGLKQVQVVEYDTQKLKVKATPELFVNTWSAVGFYEEGTDLVMLSLNNQTIDGLEKSGVTLIKPTEGRPDTHIRFIPERGMDLTTQSTALDVEGNPFTYKGMLIPHQEIVSLSEFFQYGGDAPNVMYVYRPCDEALQSLEYVRKSGYKNLKEDYVVRSKDVISGYDSIGALLTFENGDKYGGWSICSIEDARRMKFLSGPTTMQVGAFLSSTIKYLVKHSNEGLILPEEMDYKTIFRDSQKYLGKVYFKKI